MQLFPIVFVALTSVILLSTVLALPKAAAVVQRSDDSGASSNVPVLHSGSSSSYRRRRARRDRDLIIGNILCVTDIANICICELDVLIAAFANASTDENEITKIQLCYGSFFRLTEAINITGKAFSLRCIRPEQCTIRGSGTNMFVGAPKVARFVFLSLEFGESEYGGAMHLTGGFTLFINLYVNGNDANVTGGALYIEGNNTKVVSTGTIFEDNLSNNTGGAITVANGAIFRSIRSSFLRNEALVSAGAIHNKGGTVEMSISFMFGNIAPKAQDILFENGKNGTVGTIDCKRLLKSTFCDGKAGIVQATNGSGSTNCFENGVFSLDPRCAILDILPEEDD